MARAPAKPGVYLMKDREERVIYVGKARNLRTRLRSYAGGKDTRPMIPFLLPRIGDVEWIVTGTEKEALILENSLIKKHKPRFNVNLRDDKNFFSIRIDLRESFPRLELVRRIGNDGARYFGPFSSSQAVKETLKFLHLVFPLRSCKDNVFKMRNRPCIEYEIKRCLAPCCGKITAVDYKRVVSDAILFLEGREKRLVRDLRARMHEASERMRFEEAALLRDRIDAIERTLEKQRVVSSSFRDQDVFAFARSGEQVLFYAIFVRKGTIVGQHKFPPFSSKDADAEILSSVLKQYYDDAVSLPREVVIAEELDDRTVIEEWLTEKKGRKVSIVIPRRGARIDLLNVARKNAENALAEARNREKEKEHVLDILAGTLQLRRLPRRIECFDISNIGGRYAVGSMVTFRDGEPDTAGYRRFRIRTKDDADDYAMMREVLTRRYGAGEELPDLIVVDGGKGQLSIALDVLAALDISDVDTIGLAKESRVMPGKDRRIVRKDEDRVYLPKRKNPLYLTRHPQALFLLQRVRDEAHRFAVSYFRTVKEREDLRSTLDDIPGVGVKRKQILLTHFKGVDGVRDAGLEELTGLPGIGEKAAQLIFDHFRVKRDS